MTLPRLSRLALLTTEAEVAALQDRADALPCRCDRLPENHRPCFDCRWNARTESATCSRCDAETFYDFGEWRTNRGAQHCGTTGRRHAIG